MISKSNKLVSIVTVCYNPGLTILSAINSVIRQTYSNIEYIIVDGGSSDGTLETVRSYGGKISEFISEPDNGIYDAINKGIRLCSGNVIGFVHADDELKDANVIADIVHVLDSTRHDGVYGDLLYVSRDRPNEVIRYWKSGCFSLEKLGKGWMPPHPTLYLRREVYDRACLPNGDYFDTSIKIASDYDFMMRLLGKMNVSLAYIPRVLVSMKAGGTSNNSLRNMVRKSYEDYISIRRNSIGGIATLIAKNLRKLPQFV